MHLSQLAVKFKNMLRDGILGGHSGSVHTPVHYTKSSIINLKSWGGGVAFLAGKT